MPKFLPRPASPRGAATDLWRYLVEARSHKWPVMALSATLTGLMIWAFVTIPGPPPEEPEVIWFRNYDHITDSQIIEDQKRDLAMSEEQLLDHQKDMQKVADMMGIDWRESERRNRAKRNEVIAELNRRLDARLAEAKAREAAVNSTGAKP